MRSSRTSTLVGSLGHGIELLARSSAVSALLALRWARSWKLPAAPGIPPARPSLCLLAKIALDEVFFASELITAPFVSHRDTARIRAEISDALDLYEARGWLEDPASYHPRPPRIQPASLERVRSGGIEHRHLSYASGYSPHPDEPGTERWLSHAPNHTAHARLLEHPGAARPWLVCVPGYRMGQAAVDFAGFHCRWLHEELGLNIAIPVMPLHGPRSVGRRGGDGFFTGDFIDTIHAQAQAVWDVRGLIDWLRHEGAPAVGVYGVSLGGYTAALLASLEDDLKCVIAGIPASDFLRLITGHMPGFLLRAMERAGLSQERIGRLLRVISPLALEPRVPHPRRYIYAGVADRLATPDHARDLWLHWGRPRLAWYQGGHVCFLWEDKVKALLREALSASGLTTRGPLAETTPAASQ